MVITLTPNPAVDQTLWVNKLCIGDVNRPREAQFDPAGKGINVSRVVHRLGWPTLAFGFLAGDTGALVGKSLEDEGVQTHFLRVSGQTRINTTVIDEAGATSFYSPGPKLDAEHVGRLYDTLRFWLQAGRVLVLAGSLPPGMPLDAYATAVRLANARSVPAILDADGEAFRLGVEACPYAIKPNVEEAERLLGRKLVGLPAILEGAREIANRGIQIVIISMGADGAVCVHGRRAWHIKPPRIERRSTVGSGDSLVAGIAVALARGEEDLVEGLRLGTAAGAATAMTSGTGLGSAADIQSLLPHVSIEPL